MQSTKESANTGADHGRAAPLPAATISVDPVSQCILSASREVETMLGMDPGTLAGKHISYLRSGDMSEESADQIAGFISEAAHDLVAPLNQASALSGLLLRKNRENLTSDAAQLVQQIETAAARMTALVRGVRKYIAVMNSECRIKPVNMNDVLSATVAALSKRIENTGAQVRSGQLPCVAGDVNLLVTLCSALLDNAMTFGREGVAPVIQITAEQAPGGYLIGIADNGIGIPSERRDEVFLPFKKLHGQQYPGIGLGLAIAKKIMDKHRGLITVQAGEVHGTIFSFTLPASK